MYNTVGVAMIDDLEKYFHDFSRLIFAKLIKIFVKLLIEVSSFATLYY
jgi:hypothetical protein